MSARVVITGMGTVGPHGCGRPGLAQALRESTPLASPVDRSGGYHRPDSARTAAQVDASELRQWVAGRTARRMSPSSRYSVVGSACSRQKARCDPRAAQSGFV